MRLKKESSFQKDIKDIRGKDRYLYDEMPTLPDGIIIVDLENPKNVKSGHVLISNECFNCLVRNTKMLIKDEDLLKELSLHEKQN